MSEMVKGEAIITWDEYPIIGFAMAVMLALLGVCKDNVYLIVIVAAFFLISGVWENTKKFTLFVKSFPILACITFLYTVYYNIIKTDPDSKWFALSIYLTIYGGYCVSLLSDEYLEKTIRKFRLLLLAIVVIDIININIHRPIFFGDPINEIIIIMSTGLLVLFFEESVRNKVICLVLCLVLFILLVKTYPFDIIHFFDFRHIFPLYFEGGMRAKIIGRGQQQAQILVANLASNTFTTLLLDYGVIALGSYIALIIYVIHKIVKSDDRITKTLAISILCIIAMSLFVSVIYWTHIAFLLYLEIGILIGRTTYNKQKM